MPILLYEDDQIDPRLLPELYRQIGERKKLKGPTPPGSKSKKKGERDPLEGKTGTEILQAYVGGADPIEQLIAAGPGAAPAGVANVGPLRKPEPEALEEEAAPSSFGPASAAAEPPRRGMAGAMGARGSTRVPANSRRRPRSPAGGPPPSADYGPTSQPDVGPPEPLDETPVMDHPVTGSEMADARSSAEMSATIDIPEERGLFARLRDMMNPANPSGQAMMALGLGLLGGESRGGNLAPILGRAGLGAMDVFNQANAAEAATAAKQDRLELERLKTDYLRDWKQKQLDQQAAEERGRAERAEAANKEKGLDRDQRAKIAQAKIDSAMERARMRAKGERGGAQFAEPDYINALRLTDQMINDYSSLNPRIATELQMVRDAVVSRSPMTATIFHNLLSDATRLDPKEAQTIDINTGQTTSRLGTQELVEKRYLQLLPQLGEEEALRRAEAEFAIQPPQPMEPEEGREEE